MEQIANRPYWPIRVDKTGTLDPVGAGLPAAVAAAGLTDLFVFSHGWCTSDADAADLYQSMFSLIADQADANAAGRLPTIGFAGIFWPSLWFPDPSGPGPSAGPAAAAPHFAAAVGDPEPAGPASTAVPDSVTGAQIAAAISPAYADDADRQQAIARLGELLDAGEKQTATGASDADQQQTLTEFHALLGQLVTSHPHAAEDSGEWTTITAPNPATAYSFLADTMGSDSAAGNAQGLDDPFRKIWSGAKDAVRVASYYEMKCRAGDIGRIGIGPMLERLHAAAPGIRVHLIGHSFGARLVSFALAGISSPQSSPVASLTLAQGAFSHWSFASQQPFGAAGALADFANRVHGPLVSTYSSFDWAVSRWYPKASLLTSQNNQSFASQASQWGGMGGDGFHGVTPTSSAPIAAAGNDYQLQPGSFHPIDGQSVIDDVSQSAFAGAHSDIRHPEVAWLIVAAATSSSLPAPVG